MDRPLLTIAIPTYNRHSEVATLYRDSLLTLPDETREKLEVIVSDNSDVSVARQNAELFSGTFVKHRPNSGNQGYAQNILNCVDRASGEFLWITSDDDAIRPEELASLVGWLDENVSGDDSVFLAFDAEGVDGSSKVTNTCNHWGVEDGASLGDLIDRAVDVPFILPSSCVLNLRNFDKAQLANVKAAFGSNDFIQVPLFQTIVAENSLRFYARPIVRYLLPTAVRFNFKSMVHSMRLVIDYIESSYPGKAQRLTIRDNKRWLGWLLWHRAGVVDVAGADDRQNFSSRSFLKPANPLNLLLFLALYLPGSLLRSLLLMNIARKGDKKSNTVGVDAFKSRIAKVKSHRATRK